jgi:hypothetical protein
MRWVWIAVLACAALPAASLAAATWATAARADGLAAQCRAIGNDDTVRPYDPALHQGLAGAWTHLFGAQPADPTMLRDQANIRCMGGRLLACFTGANLPCSRMNTSRHSQAGDAWCAGHTNSDFIPAYVTGHDTIYAWRCDGPTAQPTRQVFRLDRRGFASSLWRPID